MGTMDFLGLVGISTRSALDTLEWMDETQLMTTCFLLCLIFLFPSVFFSHSSRAD